MQYLSCCLRARSAVKILIPTCLESRNLRRLSGHESGAQPPCFWMVTLNSTILNSVLQDGTTKRRRGHQVGLLPRALPPGVAMVGARGQHVGFFEAPSIALAEVHIPALYAKSISIVGSFANRLRPGTELVGPRRPWALEAPLRL